MEMLLEPDVKVEVAPLPAPELPHTDAVVPPKARRLLDARRNYPRFNPRAPRLIRSEKEEFEREVAARRIVSEPEKWQAFFSVCTRNCLQELAQKQLLRHRARLHNAPDANERLYSKSGVFEPDNVLGLPGLEAMWEPDAACALDLKVPQHRLNRICKKFLGMTAREFWDVVRVLHGEFLERYSKDLEQELENAAQKRGLKLAELPATAFELKQLLHTDRQDAAEDRTMRAVRYGFKTHVRLMRAMLTATGHTLASFEKLMLEEAVKALAILRGGAPNSALDADAKPEFAHNSAENYTSNETDASKVDNEVANSNSESPSKFDADSSLSASAEKPLGTNSESSLPRAVCATGGLPASAPRPLGNDADSKETYQKPQPARGLVLCPFGGRINPLPRWHASLDRAMRNTARGMLHACFAPAGSSMRYAERLRRLHEAQAFASVAPLCQTVQPTWREVA